MILDENFQEEEQFIDLSDKEIFTKIWITPRLVFKFLEQKSYDKFVYLLLLLAGISNAFDRASSRNLGDMFSLIWIIGTCLISGALIGWITYYLYASLLSWTGKWLNGKGNTTSILRMLAHAMIPTIFALGLLIIQIATFGIGIFQSEIDIEIYGLFSIFIFYGTLSLEIIFGIWTLIIFIIGLSEIQKLSIGNSILNMILPVLIIFVPTVLIISLLKAF